MTTKATLLTPNQDSVMDDANDAVRVNVVATVAGGSGGGMTDAEFTAHLPLPISDNSASLTVDDGGSSLTVDGGVTTTPTKSVTATLSNVASSASSVNLLASNASRLGASIYNDSTQDLFVKFGTTASSTSFTIKMSAGSYYEIPFNYTGTIDGIWASANGNARVTELT